MNDADASAQTPARRPGVLDRKIRLKVALIAVALLLIAGLAMWVSKTLECARANERADRAIAARTQLAAENLAEAIAIFANRDVIARDFDRLQQYVDNLIASRTSQGIVYIAVVDTRGRAVVHTDRQHIGERFSGLEESDDLAQSSVPVMNLTRQAGKVLVGMKK